MTAPTINFVEEMARRLSRWHLRAACRDEDPDLFFVERGHDYVEARKICATCPVFDECLEEAVAQNLDDGIFAGMTAKNRRQVAKGQAEILRAVCGHCGALFVTTNALAEFCGLSCCTRAVMEARQAENGSAADGTRVSSQPATRGQTGAAEVPGTVRAVD